LVILFQIQALTVLSTHGLSSKVAKPLIDFRVIELAVV
jgi:hypothetical protein